MVETPLPDPLRTLEQLNRCGLARHEAAALRFEFEAPNHRAAAALASELRPFGPRAVRVRPSRPVGRVTGRWTVTLETSPAPLHLESVLRWEIEMHAVQHVHRDCAYLGWHPLPHPFIDAT